MTTDKAIFDFITRSENIQFSLDLALYVEDLKKEMQERFWIQGVSGNWEFVPFPKRYRKDWEKSYIAPDVSDGETTPKLKFAFGQNTPESGYKLMWGVQWTQWTNPLMSNLDHPSLTVIHGILVSHQINYLEPPKWIRWGDYPLTLLDADFLARMNNDPDPLMEEVVEDVWELFSELRPHMENVNATVKRARGKVH
jgi:hypothetical protein